jgi:hypothetical protein
VGNVLTRRASFVGVRGSVAGALRHKSRTLGHRVPHSGSATIDRSGSSIAFRLVASGLTSARPIQQPLSMNRLPRYANFL